METVIRMVREFAGLLLIGIGLVGVLVPVMPTVPFLLAAAWLLGKDHRAVRPFTSWLDRWRGRR